MIEASVKTSEIDRITFVNDVRRPENDALMAIECKMALTDGKTFEIDAIITSTETDAISPDNDTRTMP